MGFNFANALRTHGETSKASNGAPKPTTVKVFGHSCKLAGRVDAKAKTPLAALQGLIRCQDTAIAVQPPRVKIDDERSFREPSYDVVPNILASLVAGQEPSKAETRANGSLPAAPSANGASVGAGASAD